MSDSHLIKTCTQCGARKPGSEFHAKAASPDGKRTICRACISVKAAEYRALNPEVVAASKARWARLNPEKVAEIERASRARRPKTASAGYTAAVRNRNPDLYARMMAKWSKRRADRLRATPKWFDADKVTSIYRQAGRMRKAGFDVHVDHIYPLRGALVCGLHVHQNLRIIPAKENISKGAAMPAENACIVQAVPILSASKI